MLRLCYGPRVPDKVSAGRTDLPVLRQRLDCCKQAAAAVLQAAGIRDGSSSCSRPPAGLALARILHRASGRQLLADGTLRDGTDPAARDQGQHQRVANARRHAY